MNFRLLPLLSRLLLVLPALAMLPRQAVAGDETNRAALRAQFFTLCDAAVVKVTNAEAKGPYFADSYAVRALCVAYDLTGKRQYLDACRNWSGRMVEDQSKMIPPGAYYMHYNRKPGESTNDWYVADSSSIGMAVLATAVRCRGAEQRRLVDSAKRFAALVMDNYVKPSGGVSDGCWAESNDAWWCSSALFGSFLFNLHAVTGDRHYLQTALGVTDWLDRWDLAQDQPFPLSQQGPAMIFYVMENYSAGWRDIEKDAAIRPAALAKVNWCLDWMAEQQGKAPADRPWPITKGWGMKFGGLPFHEYVFSQVLPAGEKLKATGDAELERLMPALLEGKPGFTQLSVFTMFSCAQRLDPGAVYRVAK
ncbi:MAG TPA: hypothetical protein VFV81_07690 [Verrucomicrobiae bacterium]|nr:hypothetical protein [Verrucomicrobiae bacterium]